MFKRYNLCTQFLKLRCPLLRVLLLSIKYVSCADRIEQELFWHRFCKPVYSLPADTMHGTIYQGLYPSHLVNCGLNYRVKNPACEVKASKDCINLIRSCKFLCILNCIFGLYGNNKGLRMKKKRNFFLSLSSYKLYESLKPEKMIRMLVAKDDGLKPVQVGFQKPCL